MAQELARLDSPLDTTHARGCEVIKPFVHSSLSIVLFVPLLLAVAAAVYGHVSGKREEAERQRRDEETYQGLAKERETIRKRDIEARIRLISPTRRKDTSRRNARLEESDGTFCA
jgi:hypothetical protein